MHPLVAPARLTGSVVPPSDSAANGRGLQGETGDSADSISSITFASRQDLCERGPVYQQPRQPQAVVAQATSTDTVMSEWGVNGRRLEEGGDSGPKRIVRFEVSLFPPAPLRHQSRSVRPEP